MTLTELTYNLRKSAPFAILGFILLVVFFLVIQTGLKFYADKNRPTGPAIQQLFGPLPPLTLQNAVAAPVGANFTLDNIEGRPTTSTDSARIYALTQEGARFSFLQTITLMAKAVGFDTQISPHRLEGTKAIFENAQEKLTIDITNFNFEFEMKVADNPDLLVAGKFPQEDRIVEEARGFMTRMDKYTSDLAQGKTSVTYHHYNKDTGDYEKVDNPSFAEVAEVDFFKPDLEGFPVVAPEFNYSQNYVVLMFDGDNSRVIKAGATQFPIDTTTVGIYPVKTGDQAWQELTDGKGYIVLPGKNDAQITIRSMFIAYLDPNLYQAYLQPVYVFLGDNDFVAYVPAIETAISSPPQDQ